ncbi:hypothetical protein CHF27_002600 [Romboutsia maritimum]|uniref:Uncharacterized protein n=1 Tax=Romboutsia maritimum TaxID=2020948 RepID=A0A371IVQ6_9FIRM|nr:hypothetical protein [Romboutsia maritimum]RDY24549.1 hypothetical protein CHF27_002600 [Romboutsia maritimum]
MARGLRSKYNSTGERCVDACLNYGELRYTKEDGSPTRVEIPCDKYEEAISDFDERVKDGITQTTIDPKTVLNRGAFTYSQAKNIANEGKIKGLDFFEIDGSIECEHVLGISGSMEYALSIWNGDSPEDAAAKGVLRSMQVYGDDFIKELSLDNTVDTDAYYRFAKNVSSVGTMSDIKLYDTRNFGAFHNIQIEELEDRPKFIENIELPLGITGAAFGWIVVQILNYLVFNIQNKIAIIGISLIAMLAGSLTFIHIAKFLINKYVKSNTKTLIDMFNEEIERACIDSLLTVKEIEIILRNITKGEISKLLLDLKGSVNKKISTNSIVMKESRFILDARRMVILPGEFEIKGALDKLVGTYQEKLSSEYNVNNA